VLFIGVSDTKLGTGAEGFGYLLTGLGVGGVLATVFVNRIASSSRLAVAITAGAVLYCLPTALLSVVLSSEAAFAMKILRGGARATRPTRCTWSSPSRSS